MLTCYTKHLLVGNICSLCQDRSNEGKRWPTAGLTSPQPSTLSAYAQSQLRLPVPSDQRRSPASRALCCPSNACCHSNSPGASEMRREPSRCDTAPTAESCPSGVAAGSQAGCPRALQCHLDAHVLPNASTSKCLLLESLRLGNNIVITTILTA